MNTYDGVSISIVGSSHIKKHTECQDSSSHYPSNKFGVAVVCDGHGSEKHFRSAKGSEIATIVAIDAFNELMKYEKSFPDNKDNLLIQIEKNIILNWNDEVTNHYRENPFTDGELDKLSIKDRKSIEMNIESAYGSTLIAAVLTDDYCFGIQIGDGDCVVLNGKGEVDNPVPPDDRIQFNITTSLCDKNAIRNFRHFWIEKPMVAILVSTDGVRNSFTNETFYQNLCMTVFESFNEMSSSEAKEELSEFLQRLTANGSGDDVSISTIYNVKYLENILKNNARSITDIGKIEEEKTINALSEQVLDNQEAADASIMEDVVDGLTKNDTEGITE
ncbi:serine/threonine protein phosphatase PrpC [Paenibacillus sp. V4I9]|uniref:PP2C family serine/threonine-protein phosphatase n=1 Tax=Paenibacillus sp. V4I9 TaxID=3042308 RepID=UPI002780CAF4|nr:PP2C family serine/threonine-protein phosphatase [Paenibacillus sp. V4I9]MDQ0885029.1 serine/threonine protein phosphatase PrpC [Paenibacillus sp. V4I9]